MKSIFLVRHAKSSWDDAAMADCDRPLNARGVKDASEMARRLSVEMRAADVFMSSPAVRAKTTAEIFAHTLKTSHPVVFDNGLYLAPASFFATLICQLSNNLSAAAIFSHNPGITDFANSLNTSITTDNIPTCGVFAVQAAVNSWSDFSAAQKILLFYDYPKLQK